MAAKKPEQNQPEEAVEVETEQGFGTGLRAQLQRRRDGAPVTAADVPDGRNPDTPFVRVDLYAAPPPAAAEAASAAADDGAVSALHGEVEELRQDLAAAAKREHELRAALAEQVEAYERRLSEESEVTAEQSAVEKLSVELQARADAVKEAERASADAQQRVAALTRREEKLMKGEQELSERERQAKQRNEARAAGLAEREEHLRRREKELSERERTF